MIKTQYIPIDELKLNEDNPRTIKEKEFQDLCRSIKENKDFFEVRPILATLDKIIFAGHMRWRAAKQIGLTEVPVALMDVSKKKQQEYMIIDNVSNGRFDWDKLANGFSQEDLKNWGMDVPEVQEEAKRHLSFELAPDDFDYIKEKINNYEGSNQSEKLLNAIKTLKS